MHILKGFVSISHLINNDINVISQLGELSTWSLTYSRDIQIKRPSSDNSQTLYIFRSTDSVTNINIQVSNEQTDLIASIVNACMAYTSGHISPYDPDDFRNNIQALYYEKIADFTFGDFISSGLTTLPERISFKDIVRDTSITIWLSDPAFRDQYDEYTIVVIPPLNNLDDFFGLYNSVANNLKQQTPTRLMEKITEVKGDQPETYRVIIELPFRNKHDTNQSVVSTWGILIYGKAGDYIDTIKDAIYSYILNNSSHSETEWQLIMPAIFERTEFRLIPRWDLVSIPNLTINAALYGNILSVGGCIDYIKNIYPDLSDTFIYNNLNIMPYDYKTINILTLPGINNVQDKQSLNDLFSDYIPVSSTTLDFQRMCNKTKEWVLLIGEMLIVAETMTNYSTIPSKFRRIKRYGVLYLSYIYDNVNYLVAAKSNIF